MNTAPLATIDLKRQTGLDVLRAIAIISVVIYHGGLLGFTVAEDLSRFGFCGVDLFFVLSGYLIGGQLNETISKDKPKWLQRFFVRRIFRIFPAYFCTLAVYFLLPSWREHPEISPLWKFLISVQNIGLHGGLAFSHAWSLAVEDQFYLFLPFILLLIRRYKFAPYLVPILILVAGVALRTFFAVSHFDGSQVAHRAFQSLIYYPTWSRLDGLTLGVILASVQRYKPQWWRRLTDSAQWLWLPGVALLCLALFLGEGVISIAACSWQFPLIAVAMSIFLICAVSPKLPFNRAQNLVVTFIAGISYSVYLTHKIVFHLTQQVLQSQQIDSTTFLAHVVAELSIYLVGAALYFAVEKPFLTLRDRWSP